MLSPLSPPQIPSGTPAKAPAVLRLLAVLLVTAPLLSACALFNKTPPPPCPQIGILADAAKLTHFRPGEGRDITDVDFKGEVVGISGACKTGDKGKAIEMTVSLRLVATRGPASSGSAVTLPYFVSVVDHQTQRILAKRNFDSPIDFSGGQRRAGVVEVVTQHIPLTQGRKGSDFDVLVGLQLTAEQLDYNRHQVNQ